MLHRKFVLFHVQECIRMKSETGEGDGGRTQAMKEARIESGLNDAIGLIEQ